MVDTSSEGRKILPLPAEGERAGVRILPSKSSRIEPLNRGRDALPRVQADRQVGPTRFVVGGRGRSAVEGSATPHPALSASEGERETPTGRV
jgi:hypothetical protein